MLLVPISLTEKSQLSEKIKWKVGFLFLSSSQPRFSALPLKAGTYLYFNDCGAF